MPTNWKSSPVIALSALVAITAVWGWTFLVVQNAVARMPVMDFLAWRFTIASLVMLALNPLCFRGMTRQGILRAGALGLALGSGYIAQTFGLQYASAAVSGFITGLFVVLTPVVSWLILRRKTGRNIWFAVVLAVAGLALLSLHGWSLGEGELLTLVCAVMFAVHIVGLGEWSVHYNSYSFSLLQIAFVAGIAIAASAPGGIKIPPDGGVWAAIGITAIFATALAFWVQTWAQSLVSPVRAAVVMTMEPVFAGFFAVVLGGQQLTPRTILGGVCVLAAMYVAQLKSPTAEKIKTTQ